MDVIINGELPAPQGEITPLQSQGNFYLNVLAVLNFSEEFPPLGHLLGRFHQLKGNWAVASPIRWQAGHNHAEISAHSEQLGLTENESQRLFHLWQEFSFPSGLSFYYHDAATWLVNIDNVPILEARPVGRLQGKPLSTEITALDLFWTRLLTESQMFFANQTKGIAPHSIQGLWFWGQGELPMQNTKVLANSDSLLKLAKVVTTKTDVYSSFETSASVLLCDIKSPQELQSLQKELQTKIVNWYGNNMAYTTSKPWLTRIWRKLWK